MKCFILLFVLAIGCLYPIKGIAQTDQSKEYFDLDARVIHRFLEVFPLDSETTFSALAEKFKAFYGPDRRTTGFGSNVSRFTLTGGNLSINPCFFVSNNRILIASVQLSQQEMNRIERVLETDTATKQRFNKLFVLTSPKRQVYQYSFTNQPLLDEFKETVANILGKQSPVNTRRCEAEYNFLNDPLNTYDYVVSCFKYYRPVEAIDKLKKLKRVGAIRNIIRGYSLSGRIYAIRGLLEMAKDGDYILTDEDRTLIQKVLSQNLTVVEGSIDLAYNLKYSECITKELMMTLADHYDYRKDPTRPKHKKKEVICKGEIRGPEFKGGDEAMFKFLNSNAKYPAKAIQNKIQGVVFVQFVVRKDGSIAKAKILRGISPECDNEALRLVRMMPKWVPGRNDVETVDVTYQIPLKFQLPAQEPSSNPSK